jgi:hypothetical protein
LAALVMLVAAPAYAGSPGYLRRGSALRAARQSVEDEFFIDFSGGRAPLKLGGFHRESIQRVTFDFSTHYTQITDGRSRQLPCFGTVRVAEVHPPGRIAATAVSAVGRGSACGRL